MEKQYSITLSTATKTLIYCGLILAGFSLFLYLDYVYVSVAFDDAYTMRLTQHSFSEIFDITSRDVHPPLYYWMLKIYSSVFGYSVFPQRLFSNFGIVATMLFAAISLRKRWGDKVALMFILLLLVFPVTQYLASEIRMYSWAMFFTLATTVFAYDAYQNGKKTDYVKVGVFALCAMYTHYYATMTVGWILIILFAALIWKKKKIVPLFATVFIIILLYLPWISHLIFQIQKVNQHYWINPIESDDILYHLYYFYSIKKDRLPFDDHISIGLMSISAIIILCQFVIVGKEVVSAVRNKNKQSVWIAILFAVFILPILSGFILSAILRPIIVPRYMLCSFSALLLCLAIAYAKNLRIKKYSFIIILSLILLPVSSSIRFYGNTKHLDEEQKEYHSLQLFLEKYDTTKTFLSEHYAASALSRLSVLYPEKEYYILTFNESDENFEPFDLQKVYHNQKFKSEFILVQKSEDEDGVAAGFKHSLEQNFMITDSLSALNMKLYKMQNRTK